MYISVWPSHCVGENWLPKAAAALSRVVDVLRCPQKCWARIIGYHRLFRSRQFVKFGTSTQTHICQKWGSSDGSCAELFLKVTFDLLLTQLFFFSSTKLLNRSWIMQVCSIYYGSDSCSYIISASGLYTMTIFGLVCISYYYDWQDGIKVSPEWSHPMEQPI